MDYALHHPPSTAIQAIESVIILAVLYCIVLRSKRKG